MIVMNITRHTEVGDKVWKATNFWARMKGLIGTSKLRKGEGLLLPRCIGIHMFGMSYPLDVIYLDENNEVIALLENIQPNTFGLIKLHAKSVLELRVGTIKKSKTQIGDVLSVDGVIEAIEAPKVPIPLLRFI